jgi:hypothetical protein
MIAPPAATMPPESNLRRLSRCQIGVRIGASRLAGAVATKA